jgi:cytoskeletal protein CcmA (bactofilin family)
MEEKMLKRIGRIAIALSFVVSLFVVTTSPVLAMDLRQGDIVTVSGGEEVDDDLYVFGSTVTIDGTVNGDVFGFARELIINGTVNGSVTFGAQIITVNGEVDHSARLAGQTVLVNGIVNSDLIALGSNVNIASTSKIGNDLILGTASARVDGEVVGDIKGGGADITITNGVGGDVDIEADNLKIASSAHINGNLSYTSKNEAQIESGARVGGETKWRVPELKEPSRKVGLFAGIAGVIWGKFLAFCMILVVGIILLLVVPKRIVSMEVAIRTNPWQSLGWGALILFATPVAVIIVMVTVIGLPVGLITGVLYGIAIYLSKIPVALLIGSLIIARGREIESKGVLIGALALGLAILSIVQVIPVVGFLVGLATVIFGLGSLVTSVRKFRAEPV